MENRKNNNISLQRVSSSITCRRMWRKSVINIKFCIYTAALSSAVLFSAVSPQLHAAATPTTTLGATGKTDLQILAGDFIQSVCGGFVQNGGSDGIDSTAANAAQQMELFDKCGEMVHTANSLAGTDGPLTKDLGITIEQLNAAVQNVATEEAAAVGSNATELSTNQTKNISKRVAALLSMKGGFQLSAANLDGSGVIAAITLNEEETQQLGGDLASNRWSMFANGIAGTGEKEETSGEDGFESTYSGFTIGADYRLTSNSVLGLAFGFDSADSDFIVSNNVAGGGMELQSNTLSAFGLWFSDAWYADAIVTVGSSSFDLDRRIVVESSSDAAAAGNDGADIVITSSTDSSQLGVSIASGFEYAIGAATLAPYARLSSLSVDVDGYDEQGNSGLALRVGDQSIDSLNAAAGLRAAYAVSTSSGVLVPQFTFEYIHEFKDDSREISALYIHDPRENTLVISTDNPDRDYFSAGLALSAVLKNGWQLFGDVKTILDLDTVSNTVLTLGARKEFY